MLLSNCKPLPKDKLSQWNQKIDVAVDNDTVHITIANPIKCPLRISVTSADKTLQAKMAKNFPVIVPASGDTMFFYGTNKTKEEIEIKFSAMMGDPNDSVHKRPVNLPFMNGYQYKVIQGYNGKYSHRSQYSKHALDFNLKVGDTICAAADGVVVGVIEGYKLGGDSKKWRDYANFITVFHPEMNLYTQYVHLMHQGSLVEVGDSIKKEQAIGLSGKTGYTDVAHLHFNVLKANTSGMESVSIDFVEGYKGSEMKKGDWIKN